ncbi:MAG TPA: response regulator transcription factor [Thermomicrobiales bacterium]|nr:response regulator transcription factor [Thermomicrobiales bacterium]HRA47085.1 response regulator transcription factor [Thermomicrobiales bacterium]
MAEYRILVVDDEPHIQRALQTVLGAHGYLVRIATDGQTALVDIATWQPDAVVLDLVMPGMDGAQVLRDVRAWSDVPIIVLSARGQEQDKIMALDLGADDYLTKPFGTGELLARMRVLLRRRGTIGETTIAAGRVVIDLAARIVTRDGVEVHLTPTEYDLLRTLATNHGKVLTHHQLLEQVWGDYASDNARQLRVYINYLRRKLEDDPARPSLIVTEPGVGYRLRLP